MKNIYAVLNSLQDGIFWSHASVLPGGFSCSLTDHRQLARPPAGFALLYFSLIIERRKTISSRITCFRWHYSIQLIVLFCRQLPVRIVNCFMLRNGAPLFRAEKVLNRINTSTRVRRKDVAQRFFARLITCIGFIAFGLLISIHGKAQDPVFTQAFLSPIYLNPAATGTGDYDLRVSGIYRRQWWTIPSSMNYMAVSVDKYIPEISGGLGLIATSSSEGYIKKSGIYASYAYNICGGTGSAAENGSAPKWFWTGGLQFGYAQTRVDYSKLVFADQVNANGYIPGSISSVVPLVNKKRPFPDFAAGMFFNRNFGDNDRVLVGLSGHHINTPDESLTYSGDSVRSQLPILYTGNLMFTHTNPDRRWSYSLGLIYYKQAGNASMQAGTEITQNEYDISLGLWYRGSSNFKNINTFSVTLAINLTGRNNERDKVRVGVAHDAEIGNKAYSYTAGSSELGFVWDHRSYNTNSDDPCKPKISSTICPGAK